jgi:hypothetical protein
VLVVERYEREITARRIRTLQRRRARDRELVSAVLERLIAARVQALRPARRGR